MKEILSRAARDQWATVLDDVQWRGEEYVIIRGTTPVARLIPYDQPHPGGKEQHDG